jgi:hypothetical protein
MDSSAPHFSFLIGSIPPSFIPSDEKTVQRYQLNNSHDGAQQNEARAEDSLATS